MTTWRQQLRFLARAWRYRLKLDPGEIAFLLRSLEPGDHVVDIGAHKGAYTYWMSRAVGPSGRVVAYEPQPVLAAQLADQMRHRSPQVEVRRLGVSDTAGKMTLFLPGRGPSPAATLEQQIGGGHSIEVRTETLDTLPAGRRGPIRLIKCDVEGHELRVFRGAVNLIGRDRPLLLFECEDRHLQQGTKADVFAFLERLCYQGFFFKGKSLLPLSELAGENTERAEAAGYINNYLFRPS